MRPDTRPINSSSAGSRHKILLAKLGASTHAPGFVDALGLDFLPLLELDRQQHSVSDMFAFRVVGHLDGVEHVLTSFMA